MKPVLLNHLRKTFAKKYYSKANLVIWDLDESFFYSQKLIHLTRLVFFLLFIRNKINNQYNFSHLIYDFVCKEKQQRWFEIAAESLQISKYETMVLAEDIIQKERYIEKNIQLVDFFCKSKKRHIIYTNSTTFGAKKILTELGFENYNMFEDLIGMDKFDSTKPSSNFLFGLAQKYAVPRNECLVIGNSILDDLLPAEKIGMMTIHIDHDKQYQKFVCVNSIEMLLDWINE